VIRGTVIDLLRSRRALVAENAMLRQQLIVAMRRVKRPRFTTFDRVILVPLSMLFTRWRQVLLLVRPETLLAGIARDSACRGLGVLAPNRAPRRGWRST
jgi:hypothetical protein